MIVIKKKRLLIVDDSSGIRETLSDILSEIGYDVDVTDNGYEAINMVRNNSYDMIVMDIKMPGNGVETLKKIKEFFPSLKVILMTAYCNEDNYRKALIEDVHAIMYKPLNVERLIKLIENPDKKMCISI